MKKTQGDSSAYAPEKFEILEDLVSRLPDDILVNIISRLTLEETARTSVLSTRWKHLWNFTTALSFDASKSVFISRLGEAADEENRSKYVNWVNKVLESHRGLCINELRICFDLDDSHKSIITNWIYAAIMSKRVQNFELNFGQAWYENGSGSGKLYTFPQEFFNSLKNQCGLYRINSLRSLCFSGVNVTGEILEFFIQSCPLDRLNVAWSPNLSSLKVVGSSVQLKYLAICHCDDMEELVISAPSLLSFEYFGPDMKLYVENVPKLVDVSIGGDPTDRSKQVIGPILRYFSQLKTLHLGFYLDKVEKHFSQRELPELRHLALQVFPCIFEYIPILAFITNSCPRLEKLTLKLHNFLFEVVSKMHCICDYPLRHLKVLELVDFFGHAADLQFVSCLIKNAIMLEKVIISPSLHLSREKAREFPKLLEPMLPQGVQLVTK